MKVVLAFQARRSEAGGARPTRHEEEALDDAQGRGVVVVVQRRELPAAEVDVACRQRH